MTNVVSIKPSMNAAEALRNIADAIDAGEFNGDSVTVIAMPDIFQLGPFNDGDAAAETVFNCNYAISRLMNAAQGIE